MTEEHKRRESKHAESSASSQNKQTEEEKAQTIESLTAELEKTRTGIERILRGLAAGTG